MPPVWPNDGDIPIPRSKGGANHRDDFATCFITVGTSISDRTILMADLDWDAVITALHAGEIPCPDGNTVS